MNEIEVSIYSPVFKEFTDNLNNKIFDCMQELYAGNFNGGEISAKISIELVNDYEFYPTFDKCGKSYENAYRYRKPLIEHKITLTLKKRHEIKGTYNEPLELKRENHKFVLVEVKKAQLSLLDA